MNELKNSIILLMLILTITSCQENQKKIGFENDNLTKSVSTDFLQTLLVDYKSDTYKIYIGENYKISDKIINWHWAALNDPDDKIDSTGKDAFLFLGEPLINHNQEEWLPSLHIETNKNIIQSFTCSILFDLADNANADIEFLRLLSKDIKQLQNSEIIKALADKGVYEKETKDKIETFKLAKGQELEHDRFEYTIKRK